MTEAAYIEHRN